VIKLKDSIKQGQTFRVTGYFRENDQITTKSLVGITITSKIRDRLDNIISTLVVTVLDEPNGVYQLEAVEGTALWPVGELYWDIFQTIAGETYATETIILTIERGQSR
jgi:hypothetical protein